MSSKSHNQSCLQVSSKPRAAQQRTWPLAHVHVAHLDLRRVVLIDEADRQPCRRRDLAKQQVCKAGGALCAADWLFMQSQACVMASAPDGSPHRILKSCHPDVGLEQLLTCPGLQAVMIAPTRSDCCSQETSRGPPWMRTTMMCAFVNSATPC